MIDLSSADDKKLTTIIAEELVKIFERGVFLNPEVVETLAAVIVKRIMAEWRNG